MVIFEGVTLIYLYNVPLRPHGVYCQHEPQWGDIFSDEALIWDILFNFTFSVCVGSKFSESPFYSNFVKKVWQTLLHSSMYGHVEFFDKSVKKHFLKITVHCK